MWLDTEWSVDKTKKSRFQIPYMDVNIVMVMRFDWCRSFQSNPVNLAFGEDMNNCVNKINPFSFGEVALSLNVMTKKKKAVTGRRDTAVYLAQLLEEQLTQKRK